MKALRGTAAAWYWYPVNVIKNMLAVILSVIPLALGGMAFCLFSTSLGYCMPNDIININLGAVDFYRPLINQLDAESPWTYAFSHFEELRSVIQTCRTGRLLGPDSIYELLQQLHSEQLVSLANSMFRSVHGNAPLLVNQQFQLLAGELVHESSTCMDNLENMAAYIATIRGVDISNQSVSESLPALLRGFHLPPDLERFYANELLQNTGRLYSKYTSLLTFLRYIA